MKRVITMILTLRFCLLAPAVLAITAGMEAQEPEWEHWGTADFTDGWIVPCFTQLKPGECHWTVEVEKSRDGELYRLVDPYHQPGFIALFDEAPNTTGRMDVVLDCSDPEYVVVAYQPLFEFAEGVYAGGARQMVWGQSRAAFLEETGRSRSVIVNAGLNSTFADGQVTVRDCYIGFTPYAADGGKMWNAGAFNTLVRLIPAGVESVSEDCGNAEPRYFDMRGVEVVYPAPGHIYVVKRGNDVRKVGF